MYYGKACCISGLRLLAVKMSCRALQDNAVCVKLSNGKEEEAKDEDCGRSLLHGTNSGLARVAPWLGTAAWQYV